MINLIYDFITFDKYILSNKFARALDRGQADDEFPAGAKPAQTARTDMKSRAMSPASLRITKYPEARSRSKIPSSAWAGRT